MISQSRDSTDINVDVDGLVRRLLLFDTYILYSVRLKEIPALVPTLGYEGLHQLLSSGALEIRCECAQFAEGQFNTPACPLFTYQFHVIVASSREQYVQDCLQNLHQSNGLKESQIIDLKNAVVKVIRNPNVQALFRTEIAPAFEHELLQYPTLAARAVGHKLAKTHDVDGLNFDMKVHKVGDDRFEVETDLPRKLNIGREEAHNVIKSGLLAVAGLSQRIAEMKAYEALSGFIDEELPLFRDKLDTLSRVASSEEQESRFKRVASIAGMPQFVGEAGALVNVEKLLELRMSPEAREFRDWLSTLDSATDKQIQEHVAGLTAKLGLLVHGTTGKAMRFMVTTATGLIPVVGPLLGMVAGVLDKFLTETILRRSGIAAFINELYPSLFEPQ